MGAASIQPWIHFIPMGEISVEAEASCRPYWCWLLMSKATAEIEDNCLETGNNAQMLSQPLILQNTFSIGGCVDDGGWAYWNGLHSHPIVLKGNQLNKRRKKRATSTALMGRYQLCVSSTVLCTLYPFYNMPNRYSSTNSCASSFRVVEILAGFLLLAVEDWSLQSKWFCSSNHVLNYS